jgi:hypothetical protein
VDGALLRLEDPYGVPKLHVRLSKDVVEDIEFPEVSHFARSSFG